MQDGQVFYYTSACIYCTQINFSMFDNLSKENGRIFEDSDNLWFVRKILFIWGMIYPLDSCAIWQDIKLGEWKTVLYDVLRSELSSINCFLLCPSSISCLNFLLLRKYVTGKLRRWMQKGRRDISKLWCLRISTVNLYFREGTNRRFFWTF